MPESFSMWTVYEKPTDFPNSYVARKFRMTDAHEMKPTNQVILGKDIERIRGVMESRGLTAIPRNPMDDPCIVESWV